MPVRRQREVSTKRRITVKRGGDPQKDWMRWRQPKTAILELLTPVAREQMVSAGLNINIVSPTSQAQYSPLSKTIDVRSGMGANEIRHEQFHAGLALTPGLFPNVGFRRKFASSPLGTVLGAMNTRLMSRAGQQYWAETGAISLGGAAAYPGYKPAFDPQQFSNVFDVQQPSWQYR